MNSESRKRTRRLKQGLGRVLNLVLGFTLLSLPASAMGAVSYPASTGTDGPLTLSQPSYTYDTTTGISTPAGVPAGAVVGPLRVLNLTTIDIAPGTTLRMVGNLAPDLRATGSIQINGAIDVGADDRIPGPGSAAFTGSSAGSDGAGPLPGAGGSPGGGAGADFGGGGGGSGFAGGGGGAGGLAGHNGGQGGGPTSGVGGVPPGNGGSKGVGGPAGATDGASAPSGSGGGGGGGSYGNQGPFMPGSGGGGGGGRSTTGSGGGDGGGGGGTIRLVTPATLTLGSTALITANGGAGSPGETSSGTGGGAGGGGSGGSVRLIGPTVNVVTGGVLQARGGIGGVTLGFNNQGGNGGAGRIDISANTLTGSAFSNPLSSNTLYSATVSVLKAGSGAGTVHSAPGGITCGADCSEEYDPGSSVTLTSIAGQGSSFDGWAGCDAVTGSECTVSLNGSRAVTATFSPQASDQGPGAGGGEDGGPPQTTITKAPKDKTKKKRATFEFTGTDARAVASFQCSLDGAPFAACTSPHTVKVKKGKHTFDVRAVDQAGNVGTLATDTWKRKKKK